MFYNIIKNLIGYTGTSINNLDSTIIYASVVLVLLVVTVGVDNIFKIFRFILPKGKDI